MGHTYHLTEDQDELLSEAEKAFDLTARRKAIAWYPATSGESGNASGARSSGFPGGWLRRTQHGETHIA